MCGRSARSRTTRTAPTSSPTALPSRRGSTTASCCPTTAARPWGRTSAWPSGGRSTWRRRPRPPTVRCCPATRTAPSPRRASPACAMAGPAGGLPAERLLEVVAQDDGVVVLPVPGGVEEDDVALCGRGPQRRPGLGVGVELGDVPAAELRPPGRVVAEPPAQLVAGRGVPEPAVQG